MNELLIYLKKPIYCSVEKPRAIYFLKLIFIYFVSIIPISIVIHFLNRYFNLETFKPELSKLYSVLFIILIGPIFEEIIFRSWLRFTRNNLIVFIIALSVLDLYSVFQSKIELTIVLFFILLIVLIIVKYYSIKRIEMFISSNFKYFFYATAISFGLLHAFNSSGNIYLILGLSIILGAPQIIGGFILGFIRMKYGLIYSILFHIMINSIFVFWIYK